MKNLIYIVLLMSLASCGKKVAQNCNQTSKNASATSILQPSNPPGASFFDLQCASLLQNDLAKCSRSNGNSCLECEISAQPVRPTQTLARLKQSLEAEIKALLFIQESMATTDPVLPVSSFYAQKHCVRSVSESVNVCPKARLMERGDGTPEVSSLLSQPREMSLVSGGRITVLGKSCVYRPAQRLNYQSCTWVASGSALRMESLAQPPTVTVIPLPMAINTTPCKN